MIELNIVTFCASQAPALRHQGKVSESLLYVRGACPSLSV